MDLMIPKEMKYNLHYGKVRRDVLAPPHGTYTSCSVVKYEVTRFNDQIADSQKRLRNITFGWLANREDPVYPNHENLPI